MNWNKKKLSVCRFFHLSKMFWKVRVLLAFNYSAATHSSWMSIAPQRFWAQTIIFTAKYKAYGTIIIIIVTVEITQYRSASGVSIHRAFGTRHY